MFPIEDCFRSSMVLKIAPKSQYFRRKIVMEVLCFRWIMKIHRKPRTFTTVFPWEPNHTSLDDSCKIPVVFPDPREITLLSWKHHATISLGMPDCSNSEESLNTTFQLYFLAYSSVHTWVNVSQNSGSQPVVQKLQVVRSPLLTRLQLIYNFDVKYHLRWWP